jgi:uncharacterized protein
MPIQPTYPGVYVQEISSGVKTITGVSTSIAAFFGRTVRGPIDKAVRCTSYSDFLRKFRDGHPKSDLKNSIKQFFDNGGSDSYVVRLANGAEQADITLINSAGDNILRVVAKDPGAWGNNVKFQVIQNPDDTFNLIVFEVDANDATIASEPTYINLSVDPDSPRYVVNYVTQNSNLVDVELVTPPAVFDNTTNPQNDTYILGPLGTSAFQDGAGAEGLDDAGALTTAEYLGDNLLHTGFFALDRVDLFNLMILPGDGDILETDFYQDLIAPASVYCEDRRAFLLVDAPASWTSGEEVAAEDTDVNTLRAGISKQYAAVFYPRVKFSDAGIIKTMGASGMIAGLMARTDSQRGVWKAPAGTEADLRGALDVEINLTDNENGILNKLGVNCIRKFPNGIVNWGARTLDGSDDFGSEWKYIPIRRLALFLEESLFRGTKWIVFEPNDEPLWAKIRMNITAFMMSLFRQGAFQGTTPDKAFFVKCDSETTTQNDRNLGIVNIQIGFAPLKPAEFVIITIQQMAGDLV